MPKHKARVRIEKVEGITHFVVIYKDVVLGEYLTHKEAMNAATYAVGLARYLSEA